MDYLQYIHIEQYNTNVYSTTQSAAALLEFQLRLTLCWKFSSFSIWHKAHLYYTKNYMSCLSHKIYILIVYKIKPAYILYILCYTYITQEWEDNCKISVLFLICCFFFFVLLSKLLRNIALGSGKIQGCTFYFVESTRQFRNTWKI